MIRRVVGADMRLLPGSAVGDGGGEFGLEFGSDLGVAFDDVDLLAGVVGEVVELVFGDLGVREGLLNFDVAGRFFSVVGEFPVAGAVAVVSSSAVVLLDEVGAAQGVGFSEESAGDV